MIITSTIQEEIIQTLIEKLRSLYVFPYIAGQICLAMEKHLEEGEYQDLSEGDLFALALTMHLQEASRDEHLWVRFHAEPLPDENEALRLDPKWEQEKKREAARENYGFDKVDILPGNVALIDLRHFPRAAWGAETAAAAMNAIAGAGALILDLRGCTGGYPDMVALVASHLFDEEPIHLTSIYWRDEDKTQEFWTLPDPPGERFIGKPVYVLTSRVTFSAGEVFASILQSRKRATLIGEKTDGGAHPGASYRLHPHFEVFIPIGRTIDPLGGKDFEGIGITPDIPLPQEHAFTAAYYMALKAVFANRENSSAVMKPTKEALKELESKQKFCPRCFYPNPTFMGKCKNCDELIV